MRLPILLVCSALTLHPARAENLSDADRESLLEQLDKLRDNADSKLDARFRLAMAAYRNALASDDAAIDLYLNCMEKVNFEEQQKKAADFREWKRKEAEKLSDPGLRVALRYQLRWLILTLQATSEKADRKKLAAEAQEIVDGIFRDLEKLKNQEEILNKPVTSTIFATAYDISGVKVEKWPLSPVQLEQVYEDVLLPPFRISNRVNELRDAWIKRIQQEGVKSDQWTGGERSHKRIGMASAMQSPAHEKFLSETQPKLQWDMELDLFRHGDQSNAAIRMLTHLEKHINHSSARLWSDQFKSLLSPAVTTPSAPADGKTSP